MIRFLDSIGLIAGALTTAAFVPQVWKIYRTKSGKDVSARMFSMLSVGVVLWLIYGITLFLSLTIIALKIRYSRPGRG